MRFLLSTVVLLTSVIVSSAGDIPSIRKGDRIVFLGDSITAGGVGKDGYVTLIKNEIKAKHADLGIEIFGAGVSGNKVPNLQKRLEKDVLAKKPTVVVIYIGINDVWHGEKNPANGTSPEAFEAGLRDIIGKIQKTNAWVVLCTPSVIGEKTGGGNSLDAKLDEYSAISRKVAGETKSQLCDLRKEFADHLKTLNKDNKAFGILTSDRVHLNGAGNRFVAEKMLKVLVK